jgi:hypothetical protein
MIKRLFFTAALLAPGFAYAGDPSANLQVQIVPAGGTACDTGTNAPTIPAVAQAAGFTTCALYLDFTAGGYAANTANYVKNCGSTLQHPFDALMIDTRNGSYQGEYPCNRTSIVTSPHGAQTLHIQTPLSEMNGPHIMMRFQWPSIGGTDSFLPVANYNEIVFELVGRDQSGGGHNPDVFNWWHRADDNAPPNREFDDIEIFSGGYTTASTYTQYFLNQGVGACCGPDGVDWSQPHRWGTLTTSDESTGIAMCNYLDGVLKNCSQMQPTGSASDIQSQYSFRRNNMVLEIGNQGSDPSSFVSNIDVYIHKIQYWACANWQTATCPSAVVMNPPNPAN